MLNDVGGRDYASGTEVKGGKSDGGRGAGVVVQLCLL